jgi:hypothetical protein
MKEYQSLSHTRWDCKYHVVFIPKRRKKRVFGVLRCHLGEMFHELASHKEVEDRGGAPDGRPCSYVLEHSTEVRGLERGRISEGEECDPDCAEIRWAAEELHRRAFLGQRVLRFYGGTGREHGSRVHPQPGRGRRALRPNEARHGVSRHGRLTVSWAPLRRSQSQATGFAGGI